MEGKALQLRLSVQEVQAAECQQRMQILQNEQQRNEAFSLGKVSLQLLILRHGSPSLLPHRPLCRLTSFFIPSLLIALSEGLVVGAGVESEDIAYVPSSNSGTGHFYNTQSFDHEGRLFLDIFTIINIMLSSRVLSRTYRLTHLRFYQVWVCLPWPSPRTSDLPPSWIPRHRALSEGLQ